MGGFSACVDVYLSLREAMRPRFAGTPRGTPAAAMLDELERRALAGIGGELVVDWPDGPAWIDRHISGRRAIGGTSVQAAYNARHARRTGAGGARGPERSQLDVIHPDVIIATPDRLMRCADIVPAGQGKPAHYIFEYAAGDLIDGQPSPRSSRVIVRFDHKPLEHDPDFVSLSTSLAATAGAGILCGFNEMPPDGALADVKYAAEVARRRGRPPALAWFTWSSATFPIRRCGPSPLSG